VTNDIICIYLGCPRTHPATTAADDSAAAIPASDATTLPSTAVVSPASSLDAGTLI